MITTSLRLLWIHFFAFWAVWLGSFIPGMDFMVSALYLMIVAAEARGANYRSFLERVLSVALWQMPGYLLILILLLRWNILGLYDNAIFILEFWSTPIIPWLSLLPAGQLPFPSYYYGFWMASALLTLWCLLFSYVKIKPLAVGKYGC